MSKQFKIITPLASLFIALLLILFFKFSQRPYSYNDILARSDIGTLDEKEFIARYQGYLIRTGIDDNIPARQAILSQVVNEKLLLSTIRPVITQNTEYKNEIISKRDDFLVSAYADKIIKLSISVSEKELRYRYAAESASYHLMQLFTSTYEEAMSAKNAFDNGIEFEIVASNLKVPSILASIANDLGYVKGKNLKPDALAMLVPLSVGGVTQPIKVPTGYTLLQLLDKKENPLLTEQSYAMEIGRLTATIRRENVTKSAKSHIDNYLNNLKLVWNETLLADFHRYLRGRPNRSFEQTESESLREYGVNYYDNLFLNKNVLFSIAEYFEWSNRLSYRKQAKLETVNDLQAYVKGLVARRYLVTESLKSGIDDEKFQSEYAEAVESIKLRILKQAVIDSSTIAEIELRKFYDENYSDFKVIAQVRVREIVVQNSELAIALIDSINSGYDASTLASKHTLRQAVRQFGGDLGYINVNEFGEFQEEVEHADIGKLLGPFPKGDYYLIFELLDKTASYHPGYEETKSYLREEYISNYRNKILHKTYRRLAKEYNSHIYVDKLISINLVDPVVRAAI